MCGGPSAPHDLRRAKQELGSAEYDLVSVNNHGLLYLGEVAWFYAHDKRMVEHLKEEQATVIVHHDCRNLREQDIHAGIVPFIRLSGPEALWVCDWFEYKTIHIVGVDFYQGKRRYWHQWDQDNLPTKINDDQLAKWRETKRKMQHPERVVCYNDRLKRVFDES
ncbi:MAG: hypothetical protein ACO24D_19760, partial [bacterium]